MKPLTYAILIRHSIPSEIITKFIIAWGKKIGPKFKLLLTLGSGDDEANLGIEEILTNQVGIYTAQTIELINGLSNVLGKESLLAYLVSMTRRIAEIHRVLKDTGSFYFHCDPTASHYIKLIIDSVFVSSGG